MTDIFIKVINMSIVGTMAIFIVLITRMLIKNRPKIFSYALWFLVFFRLICPISFSSAYSLSLIHILQVSLKICFVMLI